MSKIKFVTDSAADIPAKLAKSMDIEVMPFTIIAGDKEYKDGVDFTREGFFKFLDQQAEIPTHAQLTVFQYCEVYERYWLEGYTDLIYTCINAKASQTIENARQAVQEFYEDHPEAKDEYKIHIIDATTYTMAYGAAVLHGAKLAQDGASPEICVKAITDIARHNRIMFAPLSLKYPRKSGRVKAISAFAGDLLGIHPIMTFENGNSKMWTKVRGDRNVIPTLLKLMQERREENTPYILIYGSNRELNKNLHKQALEVMVEKPKYEYTIGGVIAINAGPYLCGVIYREKEDLNPELPLTYDI